MNNAVLIGLDVGDVRVGVAVFRAGIVLPKDTYLRAQGEAERKILELIAEISPAQIIVGMPYGENGERTEQSEKTERFCQRLRRRTMVPVITIDEYGSSGAANDLLAHKPTRNRKGGMIDAQSASIILQSFIDQSK